MERICKILFFCIVAGSTFSEASAVDSFNCTEDRIYDKSRSLCLVKADKDCVPDNKDCVPNSQCEFVEVPQQKHICSCDYDTYGTLRGTCEPAPIYGEPCDIFTGKRCRSQLTFNGTILNSKLSCENGTCLCNSESSRIPNDDDPLTNGNFRCALNLRSRCKRELECVPNAECIRDRCKCKPGFFIRIDGSSQTCEISKKLGESCELNEECEGEDLVCNSELKTCVCSNETNYQRKENKCLKREGSRCSRYRAFEEGPQECLPNSYCGYLKSMHPSCECFDNATTSPIRNDGHCYIKEGFDCDTNSKYFQELPPNSNYTQLCRPGLVCQNYTCSCEYKAHQIYSEKEEKCISLVGGPCTENEDCVASSECVNGSEGVKFCRCKSGFISVDRRCDLAHGEKCDQHDRSIFCNRLAPLGCSSKGECECLGLQIYYEKEGKCRALVGGKCDEKLKCVDGAVCNKFPSIDNGESASCECGIRYLLLSDRSCALRGNTVQNSTTSTL